MNRNCFEGNVTTMDSNVETFDPVIHYKIALLDSASVQ